MRKLALIILSSVILFVPVYGRLISYVSGKPIEEKLGYLPQKELVKIASLDYKPLISEWLFFKVTTYYGGRTDPESVTKKKDVEYDNMLKLLETSTYVDPYNIDAYYFAQAIFIWEVGKIREVNTLLEGGLKYRIWDASLPFFLGFNNFYFLKDYKKASKYMEQAAKITGDPFFTNLAARFFYESDETGIAISFLKVMIEKTWDQKIKQVLQTRLSALEAVDLLDKGIKRFENIYNHKPKSIEDMINNRIIDRMPEDPYGGKFFIDEKGRVRTTSKLAFGVGVRNGNSNKSRESK